MAATARGARSLGGIIGAAAAFELPRLGALLQSALAIEAEERRFFLWIPVAAGSGVLLYLAADREPVLWLPLLFGLGAAMLAVATRHSRFGFALAVGALALAAGFLSAELRSRRVAGPVVTRIRIVKLEGFVEEVDPRPQGARFILDVVSGGDLAPGQRPRRVRLTTRRSADLTAGQFVGLTARLLPPSHAALPHGYDFARDAFFMGIGAVGSALGRIEVRAPPAPPELSERMAMALDRARNALAARVDAVVGGGDAGAVAAAMVTGKRDLLSQDGRDIIRQAGIFHIITIAGVQMTLVAGLLFGTLRRLLALSPGLALRHPIKKWAAGIAILGAVAYDVGTGSRIGTERALFMTLIMFGAILFDRRALTMRNLALAALCVIAFEPEAIAGASFQLSFAAVAALIAVQEARQRRRLLPDDPFAPKRAEPVFAGWTRRFMLIVDKIVGLFIATLCATAATASFMAASFHELSPYVFIGNPLTLSIIELFAVPAALIGTLLYPLGLDAPVWLWLGFGIRFVLWAARELGAMPGSTIYLRDFAPWTLPCLSLALLSLVIWRTLVLRLTALPWLLLGLMGALSGPSYDLLVAPEGETAALRGPDGRLGLIGKANGFIAEQWLRADGDGRNVVRNGPLAADVAGSRCDKLGCVATFAGAAPGETPPKISVVEDAAAFEEDCRRADIIVTPLFAPASCGAELIIDRGSLQTTGALGFVRINGALIPTATRAVGEDRPWSPAPPRRWRPRPTSGGEEDRTEQGRDAKP
jgi:competence protein ComEC